MENGNEAYINMNRQNRTFLTTSLMIHLICNELHFEQTFAMTHNYFLVELLLAAICMNPKVFQP